MLPENKRNAAIRLKTVTGHLEGVIRMVEEDAYCVDLMKQLSAVQSALEKVNRLILRNHLETCFSSAITEGRGVEAIGELMDAVKFTRVLTGPGLRLNGAAVGEIAAPPARQTRRGSPGRAEAPGTTASRRSERNQR